MLHIYLLQIEIKIEEESSMNNLQKMGGVAALINALAYIVGFGLVMAFLAPVMDAAPEQYVAFIANNQTLMFIWHIIIYLVAGVFMVPLTLALHERLKDGSPAWMQTATAFGLIWVATVIASGMIIINDLGIIADLYGKDPAQATTVWLTLSAVEEGLGGAIELPGGLWIFLVSWSALQSSRLPKALNYLGIVVGVAGIVTVVPTLNELGYVFGIGAIVWFIWVGIVLLFSRSKTMPEIPEVYVSHHKTI
jgi:hypothetical protein